MLSRKADQLQDQLSRLGGEIGTGRRGRRSAMKGRKVPIKYRDRSGNTWAGRGARPVVRDKLKAGAKLEDFAVHKTSVASRKVSPKKSRKRRKANTVGSAVQTQDNQVATGLATQSRLRKSEQEDRWSFCLTAGTLCPTRVRNTMSEQLHQNHTGIQGEGSVGCDPGPEHGGGTGAAF